jgi:ADP-heptose:LPS heptosyltransferase
LDIRKTSSLKVLVLRFSSIGDIVLTTPVLRGLKQQAGADVHVLTKSAYAGLLSANPYVDRTIGFSNDLGAVLSSLRRERYDAVIDLHRNLRSYRVRLALGRPTRTFDKLNFEKWLLVRLKIDRLPDVHIVHRYLAAAAHLGVTYDGDGLDHFIPADEEIDPASLHPALFPGSYTALVLGATHYTKRLPPEQLHRLIAGVRTPLVLLGGPAEAELGRTLAAGARPDALVVNACGGLRLHQSASAVRQARLVVTHDTGLMHIAAALRKPIVSVWGNTVPKFGMFPFYPDGFDAERRFEVDGLYCRPCSKIGYARCPEGHFRCMRELSMEALANEIDRPGV